MGFWGDAWDYTKDVYRDIDKNYGGLLPGGVGPNDPAHEGGEYAGVDRASFDLPGYQGMQDRYGNYLDQVDQRGAPQMGPAQRAAQSQFRGQQGMLSSLLMGRAQGDNSVAEQQLKQGVDLANQRAMSMAASARPSDAAMAMRLQQQQMGANSMDLAGQTAIARAQEANQAAGALGGVLAQGRAGDENLNMFNASQGNNREQTQAQMNQAQMGMNDQARQGLLGGSLEAAQAQQQGGMNYEQNRTQRFGAVIQQPTNQEVMLGTVKGLAQGLVGG
jgi:hypothetical protein